MQFLKRSCSGFTMIELLMVIILVGLLSAVALPAFLDFRKEGKAAALRYNLNAIRVGIKNQIQQARLRCRVTSTDTFVSNGGRGFFDVLRENLYWNDILICGYNPTAGCTICLPNQIPDSDRRFIPPNVSQAAHAWIGGVDYGPYYDLGLPANPLLDPSLSTVYGLLGFTETQIQTYGGRCQLTDAYVSSGSRFHYVMNITTGDIFPGTNTPGINECNW
jgi:prepilin-type N-terminal cleavage/methylation domain-containing protein